jgi:hypothetical protein
VLPLKTTPVDHALAGELGPMLEAAAAAEGRSLREEATFAGSNTGPLLRLVRVEGAARQRSLDASRTTDKPSAPEVER